MASQILKSSLSRVCFRAEPNPRLNRKQFLGYRANNKRGNRTLRIFCTNQESDKEKNGEEPPESLFMKELKRRGINSNSLFEESNKTSYEDEELKFREEGNYLKQNVLSTSYGRNLFNQREQSMALNSEGLEGLIPRAKLLLYTGATFFLSFASFIVLTVVIFIFLYLYFGTAFIHDASSSPITPPQYIDPYALLEDQRISEMISRLN